MFRRIVKDPNVLGGKPIISGTRISVEFVRNLLDTGWSYAQLLKSYPHLRLDDIDACRLYKGDQNA